MLLSASSLFDKKKKKSKNNEQRNLDLEDLFKEAHSTLETTTRTQYKQGQELWKCVKNGPNLKEKKMHELMLKAA